jgi:hypothetical protein
MLPARVQNALLLLLIIIIIITIIIKFPNQAIASTPSTPLPLSTRQHALHDSSITY